MTVQRIRGSDGSLYASSYVEENARLVVDRMNKGELAPLLALALERLWIACPEGDTDNRKAALLEAARALGEWNRLNQTSSKLEICPATDAG